MLYASSIITRNGSGRSHKTRFLKAKLVVLKLGARRTLSFLLFLRVFIMAAPPAKTPALQRLSDQLDQLQDSKAKQVAISAYFRGELEDDHDPDKPQDSLDR
jgi:hypothetical protein